jgi:RNA polymerase sigma factor (sigma-70 family)
MTLEQTISQCKKNDIIAQEQLYMLFSAKLFGICLKYSRNYAEAQDNLQDGFLLIFEKIKQFNNKGSFEGWAKRVVINNTLQHYRKTTFLEIVNENIADDVEVDFDEESVSMEYLVQIIQELPDRYRLVFNLYVIDNYSHKDITEMLDITIGTSKSNLSRARLILKQKIETYRKTLISTQ